MVALKLVESRKLPAKATPHTFDRLTCVRNRLLYIHKLLSTEYWNLTSICYLPKPSFCIPEEQEKMPSGSLGLETDFSKAKHFRSTGQFKDAWRYLEKASSQSTDSFGPLVERCH